MDIKNRDMNDELLTRLLARLEGDLSADDQVLLNQQLANDPQARRHLYQVCAVGLQLRRMGEAMRSDSQVMCRTQRSTIPRNAGLVAAAVIIVALSVLVFLSMFSFDEPLAYLTFEDQVQWEQPRRLSSNKALVQGNYGFKSGTVRLAMQDGTIVTLTGPAAFGLMDKDLLALHQGIASAKIMRAKSRFTIRTEAMDVVDLGTAFGVNVLPGGKSTISVFEGAVALKQGAGTFSKLPMLLEAGSSVQANAVTQTLGRIPYDPSLFEHLWPLTNGINETAGLVRFLPPGPLGDLKQYKSDDTIFMIPEKQYVKLATPLLVDMAKPGRYGRYSQEEGNTIPAGVSMNSYLLFFNSARDRSEGYACIKGSITFAHPIIGMIVSSNKLASSDSDLGLERIAYGERKGRGLESKYPPKPDALGGDVITISSDRRTLSFNLNVSPTWGDQFRILVQANGME